MWRAAATGAWRVIDTMQLDPKRQLVIIRRDNVEHLILTGGPQDVVVETGIPVRRGSGRPASAAPCPAPPAPQDDAAHRPAGRPPVTPRTAITQRPRTSARDRRASRAAKSLRHTGLMRATEPVTADNSDQLAGTDSAKEDAAQRQGGSAELGDDDLNPRRDDTLVRPQLSGGGASFLTQACWPCWLSP